MAVSFAVGVLWEAGRGSVQGPVIGGRNGAAAQLKLELRTGPKGQGHTLWGQMLGLRR